MLTEVVPGLALNLSLVSAVNTANDGFACVIIAEGYAHGCNRAYAEILSEVQAAQSKAAPPEMLTLSNTPVGEITSV